MKLPIKASTALDLHSASRASAPAQRLLGGSWTEIQRAFDPLGGPHPLRVGLAGISASF